MHTSSTPFVFDIGSSCIRCGPATSVAEDALKSCIKIPSVIASATPQEKQQEKQIFLGEDALKMRAVSQLSYPIQEAGKKIEDVDSLSKLLTFAARKLDLTKSSPSSVVICEPLFASPTYRGQGLSSLFASGQLSGVVLDCGKSSTRAIAAVDGIGLPSTFCTTKRSGDSVSDQLRSFLRDSSATQKQQQQQQQQQHLYVDQIKEKIAVCASDVEELQEMVMKSAETKSAQTFKLPDDSTVELPPGASALCSEVLWTDAVAAEPLSLTQIVDRCLQSCEEVVRPHLMPRLQICGATASLPQFSVRLVNELRRPREELAVPRGLFDCCQRQQHQSKVDPGLRSWTGAAIFSSLSSAGALFSTKEEYEEHGVCVLARNRQLAA